MTKPELLLKWTEGAVPTGPPASDYSFAGRSVLWNLAGWAQVLQDAGLVLITAEPSWKLALTPVFGTGLVLVFALDNSSFPTINVRGEGGSMDEEELHTSISVREGLPALLRHHEETYLLDRETFRWLIGRLRVPLSWT